MSCIRFAAIGAALFMATSSMALAQSMSTRFGPVSVSQNTLMVRGRPVTPSVQGDMSLGIDHVIQVGSYDAVIVRNELGGNACPVMFYVVAVTAQGTLASPAFGTCSEAADVSVRGSSVSLRMATISTLAQQRAGLGHPGQMHVYVVKNGTVTDNGKPVH